MLDEAAWRADVARERAWRESLYLGDETPLSPAARAAFKGLSWYAPDPAWRLADVPLARLPAPLEGNLAATGPDAVRFLKIGTIHVRGHPLSVFEPAPGEVEETYLFVPFRDETSGNETYGAGRYLDFEPRADDRYEIDLNRCYHPYCALDDAWACALPPLENRLPFPVRAGERL